MMDEKEKAEMMREVLLSVPDKYGKRVFTVYAENEKEAIKKLRERLEISDGIVLLKLSVHPEEEEDET